MHSLRNEMPCFHKTFGALLLLILGLSCSILRGDEKQDVEQDLRTKLQGKIITPKISDRGSRLHFKSDGTMIDGRGAGPWTLYANVEISEARILGDRLEIEGTRIFMGYDDKQKRLVGARASKVSIEVDLEPGPLSLTVVGKSLQMVFLAPDEKLADHVPPFWRQFLELGADAKSSDAAKGAGTATTKDFNKPAQYDSPPREITAPPPEYSEEARRANFHGRVVFSLTVNEEGKAENIMIKKPLGMGLDEKAVEAVQEWTFKPAMRHGKPVSTKVLLEVTFRL